jgi:phytoene dehydrogenase-like protein
MLDSYVQDQRLKELLSMLAEYITDDLSTVPALVMAPVFGYYFYGGYYPLGSSQALPDLLVKAIESQGGRVQLRSTVSSIKVEQDRVVGVELVGGEVLRARTVVSNADVRRTFTELVGDQHLPPFFAERIGRLKPSCSAFMVFLGVDFVPEVEPLTMVLTKEGHRVSINVSSKIDPSLAPEGYSRITLMMLIPNSEAVDWNRENPEYLGRKRALGDELIAAAAQAIPELVAHIIFREDASPATLARYVGSSDGAAYGLPVDEWHPPLKTPVEGLYLTGVAIRPRPGVEDAVRSGMLTAQAVIDRARSRSAAACDSNLSACRRDRAGDSRSPA